MKRPACDNYLRLKATRSLDGIEGPENESRLGGSG
jgi:hypothetical protein